MNTRSSGGLAGFDIVTSAGKVSFVSHYVRSVREAELGAVCKAITRHAGEHPLIVQTDSLMAARILQGCGGKYEGLWGNEVGKALRNIYYQGVEVEMQWVRGHSSYLLNEIADRAASCGHRLTEWDLGADVRTQHKRRLNKDLKEGLAKGKDPPICADKQAKKAEAVTASA